VNHGATSTFTLLLSVLCCFKPSNLEVANSNLQEQAELQHNDASTGGSDKASDDGQCPVVSDDRQVLQLQKEIDNSQTQINKIVRLRLSSLYRDINCCNLIYCGIALHFVSIFITPSPGCNR